MNTSEKMIIGKINQLTLCLLSSLSDKNEKPIISQSSTLGGEETGQEKNKEKKSVMLMRREK